jgi:hypothetical protein
VGTKQNRSYSNGYDGGPSSTGPAFQTASFERVACGLSYIRSTLFATILALNISAFGAVHESNQVGGRAITRVRTAFDVCSSFVWAIEGCFDCCEKGSPVSAALDLLGGTGLGKNLLHQSAIETETWTLTQALVFFEILRLRQLVPTLQRLDLKIVRIRQCFHTLAHAFLFTSTMLL